MGTHRSTAVVIGGGPIVVPSLHFDEVIAADSGLDVALAAGLTPTCLVGDLDSISVEGVRWAETNGLPIDRHSPDKDHTDTALALRRAVELGACHLIVLGPAATDRFDHTLGTLAALGDPALSAVDTITAHFGSTVIHVLHPGHQVELALSAGTVFSLISMHGGCVDVDVDGARWPLISASLPAGSTRGISNLSLGATVRVSVGGGILTVVVPPSLPDQPEGHS